jgi:glycosyltransferase involved in cell wall biosynthesis
VGLQSNVEYIPTFQLGEYLFSKNDDKKANYLVKVKFKVANKVIDGSRSCNYKHLEVVIEALKILRDKCNVRLVVLGDGPMRRD